MTEPGPRGPELADALARVARAPGHELRNALNAVVVNLEVVRSRTLNDGSVAPFVAHAIEQSEESVRLADGAISLLGLIGAAAADDSGQRIRALGPRSIAIDASESEGQRVVAALQSLAARTSITAEYVDAAVILTIPVVEPGNEERA